MKIRIYGENQGLSRKETKSAVIFYLNQLLPKKIWHRLKINVHFRPQIRSETGEKYWATTLPIKWTPILRAFEIEIDGKLNKKNQLIVLAHELVHVKQYASGQMRDQFILQKPPKPRYRLKYVRFKNRLIDVEQLEYEDRPWEIEAYARERPLYYRFVEYNKNQG